LDRERAERERIQREQAAAAIAPPRIEDLSEEQREEINEAVRILRSPRLASLNYSTL
jgi:hypothetical protein